MHLNLNFLRSINKLWKSQSRYDIYFSFTFISYRFNDITQFIQHYFWNELKILLQGLTAVLFFFTLASRNMSFVKYGLTLEYIHIYFKVYNINIRNWKKKINVFQVLKQYSHQKVLWISYNSFCHSASKRPVLYLSRTNFGNPWSW